MKELPVGWSVATLADVAAPRGEKASPSSLEALPFIGLEDVEPGTGRVVSMQTTAGLKSAVALFQRGDILYGRLRPYLNKVVVAENGGAASAEFIVLPPSLLVEQRFLQRLLMSPDFVSFTGLRSTGDRPRVSFEAVSDFELPLPPLPEQQRIVAKIDGLTGKSKRAREHLDHIPRLVEKYKQAVLAAAFRGDLTREWRRNHSAQSMVPPRQADQIRRKFADTADFVSPYDLPRPWQWLRLPELGDLDRGRSRHRPRNDKLLFGGSYPFIQTGDVRQANRFLTSYSETYSEFGLSQSRLWPTGTVCITIAANIAETAILSIAACFPDSVVGFCPDADRADASYVEFFLRTARDKLAAFAPATAQKNINLETLASVRVPTAPLSEQTEIVRRIETAFAWIDRLAFEATSARKLIDHLDQSVLAKAFRGELVPQDPADEPAGVLLERIKAQRSPASKTRRSAR